MPVDRGARWFAACALLATAPPLAAQTTDPLFARLRWAPGELGSRPVGLAGAFVGLADGVKAAVANPAGLTLIPVSEIGLSTGRPWMSAGYGRQSFRVAAYYTQTDQARTELADVGTSTQGSLDSSVWEAGVAAGVQVQSRVRFGASLAWSRLRLDGQRTGTGTEGDEAVLASVHGDNGHLRTTLGMLVILIGANATALPSVRFGVSYQPGFDWSAQMTPGPVAPATPIAFRRPTLITAGFAWRAADRWTFLAQGDAIRYGEVVDTLERNVGPVAAAGFRLENVLEPRVAAEFSAPLWCGCGSVKLRGGLHYRSPGTLGYDGPDPVTAQAFVPGSWQTVVTLGASLFGEYAEKGVRFDIDSKDVVHGPELSFGIVVRF
jgi:hypothetical protein